MATRTRVVLFRRMWKRLHEHHDLSACGTGGPCTHCAAPRQRLLFTSVLSGTPNRIALSCPRCGPQSEHPDAGCVLSITQPRSVQPGTTTHIQVRITAPVPASRSRGVLAVQLRSRSANLRPLDSAQRETSVPADTTIPLSVPATLDPELHRIWALFAHRFHVSIAQARVACLP
jgi:hypothetical protein